MIGSESWCSLLTTSPQPQPQPQLLSFFFNKMGQSQPLFVYFRPFNVTQIKYILRKALMVCLGLEPGVAE